MPYLIEKNKNVLVEVSDKYTVKNKSLEELEKIKNDIKKN